MKVQKENVLPSNLFAFDLKKKYLQNKNVRKSGKLIFQDKDGVTLSQQHIPLQGASAIFESGKMSKCIYTDIHLLLKAVETGADIFLTYKKLDKLRKECQPEVGRPI